MKNEPAFPVNGSEQWWGMSLRDWFAGMAIIAIGAHATTHEGVAERAYALADAMLAERERGKNEA